MVLHHTDGGRHVLFAVVAAVTMEATSSACSNLVSTLCVAIGSLRACVPQDCADLDTLESSLPHHQTHLAKTYAAEVPSWGVERGAAGRLCYG